MAVQHQRQVAFFHSTSLTDPLFLSLAPGPDSFSDHAYAFPGPSKEKSIPERMDFTITMKS
jgi:hypothetical protein